MSLPSGPTRWPRLAREFARYFLASGLALVVDVALFRAALGLGLGYAAAAVAGFVAGASTAYVASIRWVFTERSQRSARREFAVFVAIGVLGLLLTEAVLWVAVEQAHLSPMVGKLLSTGIVFVFNFGLRRAMLFTRGRVQPACPGMTAPAVAAAGPGDVPA